MSVKVSVCVPIYGVESYIERCARSLFEQTMKEGIEFIFVNDCTKDKSIEILEKVLAEYPHRKDQVKIIHHEKNGGLVAARKTGLAHASGEYIIHCDSDDWVELDMYEKMYNAAREKNADICYCSYVLDNGCGKKRNVFIDSCADNKTLLKKMLSNNLHWNLWAKLIKAEIAKSSDLYQPDHICFGEDLLLSTQMVARCRKVVYTPSPFYHYFQNNAASFTKTLNRSSWEQLRETVDFLEKYLPKQFDLSACKADVLFKAVFYGLTTAQEFKQYSKNWKRKVLSAKGFSKIKRLILLCSFFSYTGTRFFIRILRCIK